MDLSNFISSLREAITALPTDALLSMGEVAANANQIIQARVIETGVNAKGVSLTAIRDYSAQYKRKKAGLTAKKIKNANKRLANDLEKEREVSPTTLNKSIGIGGRYRGFVDLTFTGRMWNNIQPKIDQGTADEKEVRVSVGPIDEIERKKLQGNVSGNGRWPGRGDILDLSKAEAEPLGVDYGNSIVERFNSHF